MEMQYALLAQKDVPDAIMTMHAIHAQLGSICQELNVSNAHHPVPLVPHQQRTATHASLAITEMVSTAKVLTR